MKLNVPAPILVPVGIDKSGHEVNAEMTFADFLAAWVFPFCGRGAKDAFRNAKLFEQASTKDSIEIEDGFFVEIRNALTNNQLNQGMAFRLVPFLKQFVDE